MSSWSGSPLNTGSTAPLVVALLICSLYAGVGTPFSATPTLLAGEQALPPSGVLTAGCRGWGGHEGTGR